MRKRFNDTGGCIPGRHYMVDTTAKLDEICQLVDWGEYFTINRPRQFGKTTTLFLLAQTLSARDDYVALKISFEGIGTESYERVADFLHVVLNLLIREFEFLGLSDLAEFTHQEQAKTKSLDDLSQFVTRLKRDQVPDKALVLLIDEVDKSKNHQIFLDFLSLLRDKYLRQNEGRDYSFQSVILAGVYDIKTLKRKIRPDSVSLNNDRASYNSPWNIAVDFKVDLSFAPHEIETMLRDYAQDKQIRLDIPAIAERLYYYTAGYPYLVSKLCKFIDEDIGPHRAAQHWTVADVDAAFAMIVAGPYATTLFDSLVGYLENDPELYEFIFQIAINGESRPFAIDDPLVNLGHLYGILTPSAQERCQIHNRIFEQRIYNYMISKFMNTKEGNINRFGGPEYITETGLDVGLIL